MSTLNHIQCVLTMLFFACAFDARCVCGETARGDPPKHEGLTAQEWKGFFPGKRRAGSETYLAAFEKMSPISKESLQVLAELLDDKTLSNDVVYVMNTIAEQCGTNATALVPHIGTHLAHTNRCVQLSALYALRSIGEQAKSMSNEVGHCLGSPYVFIRKEAAMALSAFGEAGLVYLPKIRTLWETEEPGNNRSRYKNAIDRMEKAKKNGPEKNEPHGNARDNRK